MKKITASIIIIEILLSIIFSNASAAIDTDVTNTIDIDKNTTAENEQGYTTDVDTVIADLFETDNELETESNDNSSNENIFENGVFVTEESREYLLNLIK